MSSTHYGGEGAAPAGRPSRLDVLATVGCGAVLLYVLVTEHRAHLLGGLAYLPFLLLLLCPLMHLFVHGGLGGRSGPPQGDGRDVREGRRATVTVALHTLLLKWTRLDGVSAAGRTTALPDAAAARPTGAPA